MKDLQSIDVRFGNGFLSMTDSLDALVLHPSTCTQLGLHLYSTVVLRRQITGVLDSTDDCSTSSSSSFVDCCSTLFVSNCQPPGVATLPDWMKFFIDTNDNNSNLKSSDTGDQYYVCNATHFEQPNSETTDDTAINVDIVQVCGSYECCDVDGFDSNHFVLQALQRQKSNQQNSIHGLNYKLILNSFFSLRLAGQVCIFKVVDIRAEFMSSELCCVNVSEIESVHVKRNSFAIQHVKSDMYSLYTKLEPFKTEILDFVDVALSPDRLSLTPNLRCATTVLVSGAHGSGKSSLLKAVQQTLEHNLKRVTRIYSGLSFASFSTAALELEQQLCIDIEQHHTQVLLFDDFLCSASLTAATLARALQTVVQRFDGRVCAVVCVDNDALLRLDIAALWVGLRVDLPTPSTRAAMPWFETKLATTLIAANASRGTADADYGLHSIAAMARINIATPSTNSISSTPTKITTNSQQNDVDEGCWAGVAGYEKERQQLLELVEWPMKHGDAFTRLAVTPARGVLLHGPSGCGKTLLANSLLERLPMAHFSVKGSDLLSRYFGGTESAVRSLFARARRAAPSVVWLDEIDTLAPSRDDSAGDDGTGGLGRRILSTLLAELDGVSGRGDGVLVLAATSRIDLIDSALLRPGRFDRLLKVDLPGADDRRAIVQHCVAQSHGNAQLDEAQLDELVERTDGFSGAALVALYREAAFVCLRDHLSLSSPSHDADDDRPAKLEWKHFRAVLKQSPLAFDSNSFGNNNEANDDSTEQQQPALSIPSSIGNAFSFSK